MVYLKPSFVVSCAELIRQKMMLVMMINSDQWKLGLLTIQKHKIKTSIESGLRRSVSNACSLWTYMSRMSDLDNIVFVLLFHKEVSMQTF